MKDKIILFVAGLLTGAIIATGAIYFYVVADGNGQAVPGQMGDGAQMNGAQGGGNGTPPEMPSGNNNSQSNS